MLAPPNKKRQYHEIDIAKILLSVCNKIRRLILNQEISENFEVISNYLIIFGNN